MLGSGPELGLGLGLGEASGSGGGSRLVQWFPGAHLGFHRVELRTNAWEFGLGLGLGVRARVRARG